MVIRFCPNWNFDKYEAVIAKTFDEMSSALKKEFERIGNKEFSYLWFEDGYCAGFFTDDEDPAYENDTDKMIELITKRVEGFGVCLFHYDGGMIAIYEDDTVEDDDKDADDTDEIE